MQEQWNHKIFNASKQDFLPLALEIFRYQYEFNEVYRDYTDALGVKITQVTRLEQIPFLPIRFFKSHMVKAGQFKAGAIFESSGTTGSINSQHFVKDTSIYKESFLRAFEMFYGPVHNWCIIGLLPSYFERSNSSLVYMVHELVQQSQYPLSGFYLDQYGGLHETLVALESQPKKTLLIGVTFALLDFAERYPLPLNSTVIMETGGMKGRRKEMVREEVHGILGRAFSLSHIHSEYGMTELLSQAYSKGDGIFECPPWMKVLVRDEEDPMTVKDVPSEGHVSGAINIIDLANVHSCSFIATDDACRLYSNGSFEVLGRIDNSDLRGCSLMVL
jgi:phenylacetate-coenzyme A ligase PaaK-like adenylate-forming protein